MSSAAKATDYLNSINWKSLVEYLTAEVVLNRPTDPVQFCRDILGAKLSERGVSSFNPEKVTDWLRFCYTEATALVDEHGIIHGKVKETGNQSLPEQLDEIKRKVNALEELMTASKHVFSLSLNEASTHVIAEARRVFKCDSAVIYITDMETHEIVANLHDIPNIFRNPLGQGVAGIVATTGETINIIDASHDPRYINQERDKKHGYDITTILCVPLISTSNNNDIIGAIEIINKTDGLFSKSDEIIAQQFGLLAGTSLNFALHFKETDGYRNKSRMILEILKTVQTEMSSNTLMTSIAQLSPKIIDADKCVLYLMDNAHQALFQMQGSVSVRIPSDQGYAGTVISTGQMKNIKDAYDDPSFNQINDKKSGYRTKNILCVPIRSPTSQSQIIGVLQYTNKISAAESSTSTCYRQSFTDEDVFLISSFASIICPLVSASTSYQQLLKKGQRSVLGGNSFRAISSSKSIEEDNNTPQDGEEDDD